MVYHVPNYHFFRVGYKKFIEVSKQKLRFPLGSTFEMSVLPSWYHVLLNYRMSADPKVKSHAVDWSAFSALEDLREEEEQGDLGDFSVFGSTLKKVNETEVCTSGIH